MLRLDKRFSVPIGLLLLIILLLSTACNPSAPSSGSSTESAATDATGPSSTAVATAARLNEQATATATAQTVEPVPGLLIALQNEDGGWGLSVVEESGNLRRLVEEIAVPTSLPDFDVSPSGTEILYAYEGDIWHLDMNSGKTNNVTQTEERDEQAPRWWPTRDDSFLCGSRPVASAGPSVGYLTLVGVNNGCKSM